MSARDFDALADGALDGETAAIDLGPDVFDDDSSGDAGLKARFDWLPFAPPVIAVPTSQS